MFPDGWGGLGLFFWFGLRDNLLFLCTVPLGFAIAGQPRRLSLRELLSLRAPRRYVGMFCNLLLLSSV
jgi:hypothetical protein